MRKLKKSLAVLLAALMLASFMPLFASAEAISITRNNVVLVPPTVTPSVIDYGQTLGDLTVTGGECWYVDPDTGVETLVPGHFEVRSTTTKPAVSEAYAIPFKFVSDDTTQYSNIATLLETTSTIKSGTTWPTVRVKGAETVLATPPTAADIQTGQMLRKATLSGAVVNDADGNAVSGTWSYVNASSYPTTSGKFKAQFKATGYETIFIDVDVNVTSSGTATLSEAPTLKYYVEQNYSIDTAQFVGGKVVDADGAEITTGKWMFVEDENVQLASDIVAKTEGTYTYKAVWLSEGLPPVFADVPLTVAEVYTVDKPTLSSPVPWVTGLTFGTLPFIYGESSVPGTYTVSDADSAVVQNQNRTQSVKVTFTPENIFLKPKSWSYSFKIKENDVWYTPSEEPLKIVVPYGYSDNSVMYAYNTGNLGGALNWPEHFFKQGVYRFSWSTKTFDVDISALEVGEMVLVPGVVWYKDTSGYSSVPENVYIQIQPGVYDDDFGSFAITVVDNITQKCAVKYSCSIPGITGTVTLRQGETVLGTFTPDENGEIKETVYFTPEEDGKYAFTATYTPGVMDKVTIENPVLTSREVELDIKKQIDIFVYDNALELKEQNKATCGVETWRTVILATELGYIETDIEGWEAYDQNGNKVDLYTAEGTLSTGAKSTRIYFVVPEEDSGITELHLYPIGPWSPDDSFNSAPQDNSMLGRFLEYWQKLIDFIIEIYQTIASIFDVT